MAIEFENLSNLVERIEKKIKLFDNVLSSKSEKVESNFKSIKLDISGKFDRLVKLVSEELKSSFEEYNR